MPYATNEDVERRMGSALYVQLTDDAGAGIADESRVSEAVQAAEGLVNSYLGRRYAVPVDTVAHAEPAPLLRSVTLDLVEYRLHARRPPIPEEIHRKYEASLRWLELVAEGRVTLPAVEGNPAMGIVAEIAGPSRIMSRGELQDV